MKRILRIDNARGIAIPVVLCGYILRGFDRIARTCRLEKLLGIP